MSGAPAAGEPQVVDPVVGEGHPDRWRILVVLCGALCVVVLDNTILAVAVPRIGRDLGAGETALQWITTAYGLVLAGLLLPLAGLGDRFGRKGLLLLGLATFGLASGLAALAETATQLAIARGVMGVGGAATMPATLAVLGNVFAEEERGRAIAVWSGASALAAAGGPVVGGLLLAHFWWGSVFLVNVPFCALIAVLAARLVPTSKDPAQPAIDGVGSLLWTGALSGLLLAAIEAPVRGWTSPVVLAAAATAVALLAGFAAWERRTRDPLLAPRDIAQPRMQAGVVVMPATFFCAFGIQFVLTQWFQGVRGFSALASGLCFVPNAVAILLASIVSERIVARRGPAPVIATGLGLLTTALVVAGVAVRFDGFVVVLLCLAVAGFGLGLATPPAVELIMGSVPPERAGTAAGVNETIVEAGGAFGIAVMGSVLAAAAGGAAAVAPHTLAARTAAGAAARDGFPDAVTAPMFVAAAVAAGAATFAVRRLRAAATMEPPPEAAADPTTAPEGP